MGSTRPDTAEPPIGDLEAELAQLQTRLAPLYFAQEAANALVASQASAQRSARGGALTTIILEREDGEAEVLRLTKEIVPLKERADALKLAIVQRKRAAQLATMRSHARAAQPLAGAIVTAADALAAAVAKLVVEHRAVLAAAGGDEERGLRTDAVNLPAVSDFILAKLAAVGLPVRQPRGPGLSPVETAANVVTMVETLR